MSGKWPIEHRPEIPLPVKREVRQRCGSGCIFCGCPIYDYDHIEDYADVRIHKADNLTFLCAMHHREKTGQRLSRNRVRLANADPINKRQRLGSAHPITYDLNDLVIHLGQTQFDIGSHSGGMSDSFPPLNVEGEVIIGLQRYGKWLELNLKLFNEDNHPVLLVKNGHLRHTTSTFDVQFVGQTLTTREESRKISLIITFSPEEGISIHRGRFWAHGFEFEIDEKGFRCRSSQ